MAVVWDEQIHSAQQNFKDLRIVAMQVVNSYVKFSAHEKWALFL